MGALVGVRTVDDPKTGMVYDLTDGRWDRTPLDSFDSVQKGRILRWWESEPSVR